ncbi:MAG TPA: iron-sulfur cluster assembly accessory protein [Candidatus Nanoarchaeia archaeon]|nr:iron-sulfur cluster assembly accessory protein [Candidatus Nanoarchaeia archaeon]
MVMAKQVSKTVQLKEVEQAITEETTIGDVVKNYPEVVDTLLSFGVHCVGCHVSEWEALGDGLRGHGMEEEEVQSAIATLNKVVEEHKSESKQGNNFTFTGLALQKIKEVLKKEKKAGLRIKVEHGGCAGFSYGFSLTSTPKEDEQVVEEAGVKVFVSPFSLEKMKGSTIDYVDGLQGAGFKVSNPNAKRSCGCGNSFG